MGKSKSKKKTKRKTKKRTYIKASRQPVATILGPDGEPLLEETKEQKGIKIYENLRLLAGQIYITHHPALSVEQLSKFPQFQGIPTGTMQSWGTADHWVEKRRDFMASIEEDVKRQISVNLVQKRLEEIEYLEGARNSLQAQIQQESPEIKSAESAYSVINKMTGTLDDLREKAVTRVTDSIPDLSGQGEDQQALPSDMQPELTIDETRAAIKVIIHKRREALRAKLSAQEKVEEVVDEFKPPKKKKKKPPKKVVQK